MKIRKRLLLTALAAVFAGTMSFSAFAETNRTTTVTVRYAEPTIDVTVPQTGNAYINPYGLPIEVKGGLKVTGQQITSDPMGIQNKSDVDLEINVEITGEVSGDVRLMSDPIDSDSTTKSAFVYLQMKQFTEGTFSDEDILKNLASLPVAYNATKDVILLDGRTQKSEQAMAVMAKAGSVGSNVAFRLTGSCVKAPREPWTSADGFKATIVFTFSPPAN